MRIGIGMEIGMEAGMGIGMRIVRGDDLDLPIVEITRRGWG